MDSESLRQKLRTTITEMTDGNESWCNPIESEPPDDLEFCVDPSYKAPKWRTPEQEKLYRQKKLADTQRKRKKSRASKIARRINR